MSDDQHMPPKAESDEALRARINGETARIAWAELERHFARGVVIRVAPELDLVEVAVRMARDDLPAIEAWMTSGQLAHASLEEARAWHDKESELWAVVAAPWVLVQEKRPQTVH